MLSNKNKLDEVLLNELLRNKGKYLFHREGQELEFKEQFSLSGLADYFRDFAAFANNRGGYLIFGVKDIPRKRTGLSQNSLEQFEKIDSQKISGYLLEIFSSDIRWIQCTHEIRGTKFGIFYIHEATTKPIIAKKDEGKDQIIKNGEIYYRYGGRTQKIQFAELENIINKRIEGNNKAWIDLVQKIGQSGPQNAAILDVERGLIEKGENQIFVLDKELAAQMTFIKEGEFVEQKGAKALKLVGQIAPIDTIEIVKHVKENLIRDYPYSAREFLDAVKRKVSNIKEHEIYEIIRLNGIRGDRTYSAYNFRTKKHEDKFKDTGVLPQGTPCLFNDKAIDTIIHLIRNVSKKTI